MVMARGRRLSWIRIVLYAFLQGSLFSIKTYADDADYYR